MYRILSFFFVLIFASFFPANISHSQEGRGETLRGVEEALSNSKEILVHEPEGIEASGKSPVVNITKAKKTVRVYGYIYNKKALSQGFMFLSFSKYPESKKKIEVSEKGAFSTKMIYPRGVNVENLKIRFQINKDTEKTFRTVSLGEKQEPQSSALFGYAYTYDDGTFPRWDPCQVIYYKINPTNMPTHAQRDIDKAFRILSEASGYHFAYAGESDKVPFSATKQWEYDTITIAFAKKAIVPELRKEYLALGGAVSLPPSKQIVAGGIVVNLGSEQEMKPGFSREDLTLGRVLLHELGHTMNLTHVADDSQVMHKHVLTPGGPNRYQAGDTAGFASLTGLGCFPVL